MLKRLRLQPVTLQVKQRGTDLRVRVMASETFVNRLIAKLNSDAWPRALTQMLIEAANTSSILLTS
ncbi:hypothetical protein I6F14_09895 [Bradyrhizobium sp. IC3069]|uniref:Uncharacterized protein n=1 Tax=Bradyrhizobium yuanmingense TaxID=108015 RepID=A0ABV4GN92_9BRAD|nr:MULTISPECIES: hypothetical protein [Bradyrhizobium]MCA1360884.1 hypothetical protein [Bradyrhizobium sp. IC4059]MCA1411922.1 hypothetical protein [Bradyrhizobium sp. NBAIM20]MCA1460846.1 hypothetical protein [Bradyrhizobium sp. NBAIM18]MCA1518315.1 hypothetical protein [Bradyrhizobium sp. IC3069]MCA1529657.1 hypothetical protein [Bradyrhizobium yuanmingense]